MQPVTTICLTPSREAWRIFWRESEAAAAVTVQELNGYLADGEM